MQEIETENGMTFILPFRLEYFYVYNEEYFKNKNIDAKISVLIKKDNIITGGATTEEITEKSKQLSIPYRYIYFIMESIRNVITTSFADKTESNIAPSADVAPAPSKNVSDTTIFTNFLNNFKTNPEQPTEGKPQPENEPPSSDDVVVKPEEGKPQPENEPPSSDEVVVKPEEGKPQPENEPLKEMDTSDHDKLQRNKDKLLFKIEILEKIKKIALDELPYITREKIANEIVNNNTYKHKNANVDKDEDNDAEVDLDEKGAVYETNKNDILVIGNLSLEDKKVLMLGIENTEVYNKLL
jgi:hypothetical protein